MNGTIWSKAYHIAMFVWYTFLFTILLLVNPDDLPDGLFLYGGPWKYLTFLNLVLQMVFFGFAVVVDLQHLFVKGKELKRLNLYKDLLYSVMAFPVGAFVVAIFWIIFTYDRELVYPNSIDELFPPWLNHSMHTIVLPLLLLESLLQPHAYPKRKNGLAILGLISVAYVSWVCWIYFAVGIWVYPLLGKLSPLGLAALFSVSVGLVISLFLLGEVLNSYVWGK
ncbi:androgen-dependent TFPI-regulating protein [Acipenser oxyrinchus oxyrinchus]|uniref:Androgen-dependent TFPI-regulating protein n=1 Tax=Acipenser oxyrinchus oxyrinchus TaxID=40147 RepID=A0AAD8GF55_ACIOX|nr:androgen-dependent TFPI-regulating protein [Acipenser oxyrinchus oxyrinchus]